MTTVAMIDDEADFLEPTRKILEEAGYTVMATSQPSEFRSFFKDNKIDIAILDVEMPEISGYDLCEELKGEEETFPIPVVFLTSHNAPGEMLRGYFSGAHEYISKPFQKDDLLDTVASFF